MAVRSAREVAYETIRSRIITMELKPGDELNDRELLHAGKRDAQPHPRHPDPGTGGGLPL